MLPTGSNIICKNCQSNFEVTSDDFSFYEKIGVPAPTQCPDCRLQRRLTWRNERTLHKRTCDLCKKNIISVFHPSKPFPVYCSACYHGDQWDAFSFGVDVDPTKPFLAQFKELQAKVPRQYALVSNNVNCDYTNGTYENKNCYLIFVSDHNEDSSYSYNIYQCKNCFDLNNCYSCEFSYQLVNCHKANNTFFSIDCSNSYNLYFSKDCVNCHDLVGCVNLRNKSYCIFNQQYSPEEYKKKFAELNFGSNRSILDLREQTQKFFLSFPVKYIHGANNFEVTGDDISNSKKSFNCYSAQYYEDCKNVINGSGAKDCQDCYVATDKSELDYDTIGCANTQRTKFCHLPWDSFDLTYCDSCENSNNLFGCVGLRKKEYCILNKQYDKSSFDKLRTQIIAQMTKAGVYGEFFPAEFSPYYYNETINMEYFPLTKEQALEKGYSWQEGEAKNYQITLKNQDIPDHINDVTDDILNQVIECAHKASCAHQCTSAFKLTASELQFYKRMSLPLPRECHNCRYYGRLAFRNPRKLWKRQCAKCHADIQTSYSPDRPEIVYCEQCYQQEVI